MNSPILLPEQRGSLQIHHIFIVKSGNIIIKADRNFALQKRGRNKILKDKRGGIAEEEFEKEINKNRFREEKIRGWEPDREKE